MFRAPQDGDGFMGHLTRLLEIHCILSIALAHVQLQALSCKTEISFIHDETRMWSWACDMRLQRGRRVGSFSDITASNVPKLPDTLPGLESTLDSDVKVSSCKIPLLLVVSKVKHSSAFHLDYRVMQNLDYRALLLHASHTHESAGSFSLFN